MGKAIETDKKCNRILAMRLKQNLFALFGQQSLSQKMVHLSCIYQSTIILTILHAMCV